MENFRNYLELRLLKTAGSKVIKLEKLIQWRVIYTQHMGFKILSQHGVKSTKKWATRLSA